MIKRIILPTVLLTVIIGQTAAAVETKMSNWIETEIVFSGETLSFKHPGGFSKDFPDQKPVREVNIHDDAIYRSGRPLKVFEKHWDYKGFFWQGVFGTLTMRILVAKKPTTFDGNIMELENLKTLIDTQLKEEYEQRNEQLRKKGDHRYVVELPNEYSKFGVNNDWLNYTMGGQHDLVIYTRPITEDHYVELIFSFIDNNRGQQTDWRSKAQSISDNIMQTVQFSGARFGE